MSAADEARRLRGFDFSNLIVDATPEQVAAWDEARWAEIQARVEAAAPGPWRQEGNSPYIENDEDFRIYDEGGHTAADADFIAHSREDIPYLLSVIDRLIDDQARAGGRAMSAADGALLADFWWEVEVETRVGSRFGQAVWNAASARWPYAVERFRGTTRDPFYNDRRVPWFMFALHSALRGYDMVA